MGAFQRRTTNQGGELPPPDTGAAGSDNENADGAAGPNKRKGSETSEKKPAKKAAKKS